MKLKSPPEIINPQLAQLTEHIPEGKDWIHEIKFDGYRTLCLIDDDKIKFISRGGLDWTNKYSPLIEAAQKIKVNNAVFDGEIVCLDNQGRSDFQMLQNALKEKNFERIYYYVFDLLFLNGKDLREKTLKERRKYLKKIMSSLTAGHIRLSEDFQDGPKLYRECCKRRLEGIISKDATSFYISGRSLAWQKIKCEHRQEFIIGGYTLSDKTRPFRALLLGYFDKNNKLCYAGKVGTGFSDATFDEMTKKIKRLTQAKSPFQVNNPKDPTPRDHRIKWLKPRLIAEVEFKGWTSQKLIRQPVFCGLREDKNTATINLETEFHLTHPDRLIYPATHTTKNDVFDYYSRMSTHLLPFLMDRPVSILRCHKTALTDCYYQKYSDGRNLIGVTNQEIHFGDKIDYAFHIKNKTEILRLIQAGTIEIHAWQSRFSDITSPDQIVFDLDPDSYRLWGLVIDTAYEIKDRLKHLGLESFVKLTGGKGVHIHVPILPNYSWGLIKSFARSLMQILVDESPNSYTTHMDKPGRKGKIFLDYFRNDYGATAVIPYCLRARKTPSVALPLAWKDLKHSPSANAFVYSEVLQLMKKRRDPWHDYFKIRQRIPVLERIEKQTASNFNANYKSGI